ncbi:PREDICTED: polymeric immunoglobulin receptor isoform X1 [Lepidothrix coronata]|uniref:polymeric immunoglobulin receptor isoform X1 n=1 Tax=Lepidothrix coronata TaxID=321398 RepID=UPI000819BCDA|nr:PREDICTED: polymeric immunoglobulin receptor isoform X1 [Lepidothrix coronata]XP_017687654.1 PREDICTED: polymeric immunoglobulin receptor isoform X1 [Lepidothrix coronata]
MALLALIFLLALLPAGSAKSRHLPKATILSPVFGPRQVYGVVGGSATVKCFYPPTSVNRHDRKYWCRQSGRSCGTVTSTGGYVSSSFKGRISLTDYPEAENFQINISSLAATDAGTYLCGVGDNGRGLSYEVTLSVSQDPPVPEAAEQFYVKLHSTWTVICSFGSEFSTWRKYLCKMEGEDCHDIIDNQNGVIDEDFRGRVLLSYELSADSVNIMMTQMDWEDSGLYRCGAGEYGKNGKSKELDVFIYEDKNFRQLKTTVTAKTGSSATFECLYDPLKKSSTRIWAKWEANRYNWIIDNTGNVRPQYMGRVAMFENPDNGTVTVILNQLSEADNAYYWCITNEAKDQQSSAELKVIEGKPQLTGEKEVEAQVGSRVDLSCTYTCAYYSYEKYWCKWSPSGCSMLPASDLGQSGPQTTCSTSNRTVILSFDSVTEDDAGWYWCVVKKNGLFGETMAVKLSVTAAGRDAKDNPELLDVDAPSQAEFPNHVEPGPGPRGGAYSESGVRSGAAPASSDQGHGSNTLPLVLGPVAALLLIIVTAFAIVKYRQMKRSDLVSIGSYRTNISMSDFESVKDYTASNSACVKESQETAIGGDEFITTKDTPESAAEAKKAKRSSKEDADLAYSTFLFTSGSIAQGGSGGASTALDVSPSQEQV